MVLKKASGNCKRLVRAEYESPDGIDARKTRKTRFFDGEFTCVNDPEKNRSLTQYFDADMPSA